MEQICYKQGMRNRKHIYLIAILKQFEEYYRMTMQNNFFENNFE